MPQPGQVATAAAARTWKTQSTPIHCGLQHTAGCADFDTMHAALKWAFTDKTSLSRAAHWEKQTHTRWIQLFLAEGFMSVLRGAPQNARGGEEGVEIVHQNMSKAEQYQNMTKAEQHRANPTCGSDSCAIDSARVRLLGGEGDALLVAGPQVHALHRLEPPFVRHHIHLHITDFHSADGEVCPPALPSRSRFAQGRFA